MLNSEILNDTDAINKFVIQEFINADKQAFRKLSYREMMFLKFLVCIPENDIEYLTDKLLNSGLYTLDYINLKLNDFKFKITDLRLRLWLSYLYTDVHNILLILWYIQYVSHNRKINFFNLNIFLTNIMSDNIYSEEFLEQLLSKQIINLSDDTIKSEYKYLILCKDCGNSLM